MNIKKGDKVKLLRDIKRIDPKCRELGHILYAKEGLVGFVEEIFKSYPSKFVNGIWHAKVKTENGLLTFRITSLKKEE